MERTKPTPEENQSEKKRKKKRSGSEKAGKTQQVLKAPVPLEIVAEEEKAKKEKKKEKKPKAKTKKSKEEVAALPIDEQESSVPPKEDAPAKPRRKKATRKTAVPVEKASEEANSPEALPDAPDATEEEAPKQPSFSHEEIIWTQESGDEPEGELWGRKKPQAESPETAPDSENIVEDEGVIVESPITTTSTKSTPNVHAQPSSASTSPNQPTTSQSRSTTSGQAVHAATSGGSQLPPHIPAAANYGAFGNPASANTAPLQPPTAAAANRYSNRTAERRNLVAGILLGGIVEHIRHKRREKRMKATHEKEIKQIKGEQQFQQAEQSKSERKAAREKTDLEARLERLSQAQQREANATDKRAAPTETAQASVVSSEEQKTEANVAPTAETPSSFYEDFKRKYRAPEMAAPVSASRQEIKKAGKEEPAPVPRQQPENIDEPLQVSPDRRVESSAWHRIEVDKKTGKAVENPELAYGEEFRNEQHQEQLRQQIAEASMESERVKQNYMPMIDKTASTSVETHDPPHRPATQKPQSNAMLTDALQNIKDKAADGKGIDIALWIVLFIVIIAIIALL